MKKNLIIYSKEEDINDGKIPPDDIPLVLHHKLLSSLVVHRTVLVALAKALTLSIIRSMR